MIQYQFEDDFIVYNICQMHFLDHYFTCRVSNIKEFSVSTVYFINKRGYYSLSYLPRFVVFFCK